MLSTIISTPRTRRTRGALFASATVTTALLLAACGGGDDDAEVVESSSTTEAEATTTTASGSIDALPSGVEVDTTVWFGAFEIGLADPALEEVTPDNPELTIDVQVENLSERNQTLRANQVQLWVGDEQTIPADYDGGSVPGLGRSTGTLSFDLSRVEPDIDLADAEIRFGTDAVNQAIVPLDGDDVVTLEPAVIDMGETAVAGVFTFDVVEVTVQYNEVTRNQPLDAGEALLVFGYDVTLAAQDTTTQTVRSNQWRLTLPDGTDVGQSLDDGPGSLQTGTTARDNLIGFVADDFGPGDYVLTLTGLNADRDPVEAQLTVSISEADLSDSGSSSDEDDEDDESDDTTTTTES
ncbi:hypothetical protein [Rhabdothermincola salaria]|uniref:hypothetical protein n=1 Tax=Rhabdothermincola salaria TaxID=2903142 RepID=UPI001E4CFDFA|nr:hypothetical protein [Rhabdothermincola salaria]MCD9623646.1 hypothetical protein [Rhabdothermincola salaria]